MTPAFEFHLPSRMEKDEFCCNLKFVHGRTVHQGSRYVNKQSAVQRTDAGTDGETLLQLA
jgi:hypothetical protein